MNIQTVGPWILLGVGTVTLLGAAFVSVRHSAPKGLWLMWVFGFAIAGVGVYGPAFLEPYGKLIRPIMAMLASPNAATYNAVFDKVASGELPPEYQDIGLAYALERPIEDMDQLFTEAIQNSTDPAGKLALEEAQATLEGKKLVADELAKRSSLTVEDIKRFDPTTRQLVSGRLLQLPNATLIERNLNPEVLRNINAPRLRRATHEP